MSQRMGVYNRRRSGLEPCLIHSLTVSPFVSQPGMHPLSPLVAPRSIAVVGASPRAGTVGNNVLRSLLEGGYGGRLLAINPRYREVEGVTCLPALDALSEAADMVVLAIANHRLEAELAAAAAAGTPAATIFGSCVLAEDAGSGRPALAARLAAIARGAGMRMCGGNTMGFCHYESDLRVTSFPFVRREPGAVAVLCQSGSVFASLVNHNARLGVNFGACTGRELATTVAGFMDYVLELPSTRCIALFLEGVRDPARFAEALVKAEARGVPVVALKVGRSPGAARMAIAHSGALVGDDRVYDALFEHHGVHRVNTVDELVAAAIVLGHERRAGSGGFASLHESGGQRELVLDLAADTGVGFAPIAEATRERLAAVLDVGLEPDNPLDAFDTGIDYDIVMRECLQALMDDSQVALGCFFLDAKQDSAYSEACSAAALAVVRSTDKPLFMATHYSGVDHRDLALELTRAGLPVIDGTLPMLRAVRAALAFRDRQGTPPVPVHGDDDLGRVARTALARAGGVARSGVMDEAASLQLLSDCGLPVVPFRRVLDLAGASLVARALGYPVALKTATAGHSHKSDVGGVKLNITDEAALATAFGDIATRLGPEMLVARMAPPGVEMALGVKVDPAFGPMVMVAAGGELVELMDDVQAAMAPIDITRAGDLIDRLRCRRLLSGVRGRPAVDVQALARVLSRLSLLAAELADDLLEVDINPVIVAPDGCVAVDALVALRVPRPLR